MKHSTLNRIARQIHQTIARRETRTRAEMDDALAHAAGDARTKREAAYVIAIQVFDLIDHPDEDLRRIDAILAEFPGRWAPDRNNATGKEPA